MKLLINKSKITMMLLTALTMVMASNSYASSTDVRHGITSKYTIKGDDLIQLKRRGSMNLKRTILRKLFDKLPKSAELDKVTVWAKAVGPENELDLSVGGEVEDHDSVYWRAPVCKIEDVTKIITRRDGTKKEVTRPERVCTEYVPQTKKIVLNNYNNGSKRAWVLNTDLDIKVSQVVVEVSIPVSYEVKRVFLGSSKADKVVGSSKNFKVNGQVDTVAVTASRESITLTGVTVYFSDGSSENVPNVHTKVSKNSRAVIVEVKRPFKRATSVTVWAKSRKLLGKRGKMNVSVDYITSSID